MTAVAAVVSVAAVVAMAVVAAVVAAVMVVVVGANVTGEALAVVVGMSAAWRIFLKTRTLRRRARAS